jgi:hypothetical protein
MIPVLSTSGRISHARAAHRACVRPGIAPDVHTIVPSGPAITWMFILWQRCLAE